MNPKPPKPRKCKSCRTEYVPQRMWQVACSPPCALEIAKGKREKAERAQDKVKRVKLMTLSDWRKKAQAAFNAWIKARDADEPCVSCGRHHQGQYHAGHYLSTGARPELRFDEANVHKQCQPCNTHLHGNLVMYRAELIRRIGIAEVNRLEGPNPPRHDTADSLRELAATYRAKTRQLKKDSDT